MGRIIFDYTDNSNNVINMLICSILISCNLNSSVYLNTCQSEKQERKQNGKNTIVHEYSITDVQKWLCQHSVF